ncbi:DNA-binding response regulator [Sphingobacteriaceae bacterium]|nr:DNA-binding response regulator [Sphingobacteriaceae bacterium]
MELVNDILIVEDELLIAETIHDILLNAGYKSVRIAVSVEEAIEEIEIRKPGLVLTDIELGQWKNGIDLGNLLHSTYNIPYIFITSHKSADIVSRAKHAHPNAYIVKPFKNEDLLIAIELALFNSSEKNEAHKDEESLIVKEGRALIKLPYPTIVWLEASGNYTLINLTSNKRRVIRDALSEFEKQLNANSFVRIHKSYIVNKTAVTEIHAQKVLLDTIELPIGRTYQSEVHAFFGKQFSS